MAEIGLPLEEPDVEIIPREDPVPREEPATVEPAPEKPELVPA